MLFGCKFEFNIDFGDTFYFVLSSRPQLSEIFVRNVLFVGMP